MVPITPRNLAVKYPAFTPQQDHHPNQDQQMRKAKHPPRRQVRPQTRQRSLPESGRNLPSWAAGIRPRPLETSSEVESDVVGAGGILGHDSGAMGRGAAVRRVRGWWDARNAGNVEQGNLNRRPKEWKEWRERKERKRASLAAKMVKKEKLKGSCGWERRPSWVTVMYGGPGALRNPCS